MLNKLNTKHIFQPNYFRCFTCLIFHYPPCITFKNLSSSYSEIQSNNILCRTLNSYSSFQKIVTHKQHLNLYIHSVFKFVHWQRYVTGCFLFVRITDWNAWQTLNTIENRVVNLKTVLVGTNYWKIAVVISITFVAFTL